MNQITAPNNDLTTYTKDIGEELTATICVSKTKLIVRADNSNIDKYKTFVEVFSADPGHALEMTGYESAMNNKQVTKLFEMLKRDAKNIKKADTMHR